MHPGLRIRSWELLDKTCLGELGGQIVLVARIRTTRHRRRDQRRSRAKIRGALVRVQSRVATHQEQHIDDSTGPDTAIISEWILFPGASQR